MNNFQLSYSGLSESPTYIMSPKFLAIILKRAIFNCAYFQVMFENNDIYYIQSILLHDIFSAKKRGLSAMLRPGNDQRIWNGEYGDMETGKNTNVNLKEWEDLLNGFSAGFFGNDASIMIYDDHYNTDPYFSSIATQKNPTNVWDEPQQSVTDYSSSDALSSRHKSPLIHRRKV